MRPATILGGVLAGLLVAALLTPSLYLDIPRSLISDWTAAPRSAGLLTTLLAAVALFLSGMLGAAGSPDRQARAGALAGVLSGFVALTVMLPGMAVLAHGPLIELVEGGRATTNDLQRAIVTSAVRTPGYQTIGSFLLLSLGALLGWVGGVVHDLWRGKPSRVVPAIRPSPVLWLGLVMLVVAVPAQLAATVAIETYVFQDLGATPTWAGQAQLTAPLGLGGAIAAVLLALVLRDTTMIFRKGQRMRAVIWTMAVLALPVSAALTSVPIYLQVLILPGAILGTILICLAPFVGVILGWRTQMEVETQPRIFQDVFGEGVFAGVLCTGIVALHGASSGLCLAMLSMPYQELLIGGATKVQTAPLGDAIHQLFLAHLALPALMMAATLIYLTIALPLWLVSRMVRG